VTHRLWPHIDPAALEDWMRDYYYATDFDLGSSGVASFSVAELCQLCGLDLDGLDDLVLRDGKPLGADDVRQVLAERFTGGDPARVMTTNGSSEAMFLTMSSLLSAGDEVVVVEPVYQQLVAIARALGCRTVAWPLRGDAFEPDLDLLASLVNDRTRMIVVNFPHNPTGTTLTRAGYDALVGIAAGVGAYLVWDAAFEDITYGGEPLPHPDLEYERAITFGTMSKSYGLSGMRFGWCLANADVLARYVRIRDYVTLHLSTLVEFVAHRVMLHADAIVADRRRLATRNLAVLNEWLAARDDLSWAPPRGGVSAAVRLDHVSDVELFCRNVAATRRVLVVPGQVFGPALDRYIRLGFGAGTATLVEGLDRLATALDAAARTDRVTHV
jgi:capreomycidine synthase